MKELIQAHTTLIVSILCVFVIVAIVFNLFLFLKYKKQEKLSRDFFSGKNGKNLESVINSQKKQLNKSEKDIKDLFEGYEKIYKIASKGLHKVGIIRYNPFNDIGGNQSFVIALLDADKSGVIITSLHTRDNTRIFSKPIFKGELLGGVLTDEEKRAISSAKVSKKNKQV